MRTSLILSCLAASAVAIPQQTLPNGIVTGTLGDAQVVSDNPVGASYVATLPSAKSSIQGSIRATTNPSKSGVDYVVQLSGFPSSGGPFIYHIHDQPVPSNGNCTGTLAHLDPYKRGEMPPCNASAPQTCQVGDLAGKFGMISGSGAFSKSFTDLYSSTKPGIGAFIGNRSIVIHFANTTRITCANFTLANATATASPAPIQTASGRSGAGIVTVGFGMLATGLFAALL